MKRSMKLRARNEKARPTCYPEPEKSRACCVVEGLENRQLLSASLSTIATFNGSDGSSPMGDLVADARGNVFGTTYSGGQYGDGTVFKIAAGGSGLSTVVSFDGSNGAGPMAGLITDSSGNLYGTTIGGGPNDQGEIFEIKAGSSSVTALASFDQATGLESMARLAMDSAGNLYGTTSRGGAGSLGDGDGTVFELAKGSSTISVVASFDGTNGANPESGVTLDASGDIFGVTPSLAGDVTNGIVYEIAAGTSTLTTVVNFDKIQTLTYPNGDLIIDAAGNLYGTTNSGGASGSGSVFEIKAGTLTLDTLASFDGSNGDHPTAGLTFDARGDLFGTTSPYASDSPATVFEVPLSVGSFTITQMAKTNDTNSDTISGVVFDNAGNLFATTYDGGTDLAGTVLEITGTADISRLTSLNSFDPDTAGTPEGGLVSDTSGTLYGVTADGGPNDDGTIYTVAKGSNIINTFATFNGSNGSSPVGDLTFDDLGNLYGTTESGGANGQGTVFEVIAGTSTIKTVASFDGTEGAGPQGSLLIDSGNVYGTTSRGGTQGWGTVFEIVGGSGQITLLGSFAYPEIDPNPGLVLGEDGTLYGTCLGEIFSVSQNGGDIAELNDSVYANGDMLLVGQDMLIGTAQGGGANSDGTIFEFNLETKTLTTLASFSGEDGSQPLDGLISDSSGNLYGTTSEGGANSDGTIFEFQLATDTITALASFNDESGNDSRSRLLIDGKGNLFGNTYSRGDYGRGTVFELLSTTAVPALLPAQIILTSSVATVSQDQPITFTATVSSNSQPPPTGTVVFSENGNSIGSAAVQANGNAVLTASSLPSGVVNITAQYTGSSIYQLSTSTAVEVTVNSTPVSSASVSIAHLSLPARNVAGTPFKAGLKALVFNEGASLKGVFNLILFAGKSPGLDGTETTIAFEAQKLTLNAGKSHLFTFNIKMLPATLGAGTYYVLAQITDPTGRKNVAASSETVTVSAPFVQPAIVPGEVTPELILLNHTATVVVTISNTGNVAGAGVSITLSVNGVDLADYSSRARLQPGKSSRIKLHFKMTAALQLRLGDGTLTPTVHAELNGVAASVSGFPFTTA